MILYFSGTGNTEYLAKRLGDFLEDEVIDLFSYIKNKKKAEFNSQRAFVLLAPTYSWRIPRFLSAYLKTCKFSGSSDMYVIMDYGDSFGNAEQYIKKDFAELGLDFRGLFGIKMPENYIMLFDLESKETNKKIIEKANKDIAKAAALIKNKADFPKNRTNFIGFFQSLLVNSLFYKFIVKDKLFYTNDKCIKCGLCEKVCVLNNITCDKGNPKWKGYCTHCAACIGKCPTGAIEYGKKTICKDRYLLERILDE